MTGRRVAERASASESSARPVPGTTGEPATEIPATDFGPGIVTRFEDYLYGHMFPGKDKAVTARRKLAIHGYMGANGHFKTATMIRDTIPDMLADLPILSTVQLNDPRTGLPYEGCTIFSNWDQLHDHKGGPLLLDEVMNVMDARDSGAMPQHIRLLIPQLRKRKVMVRYTAPDFDNADKRLRQISWGITVCRGRMPDKAAVTADSIEAWAPNRLASAITFDTVSMTQLTEGARKKAKIKIREFWWAPTSGVFPLYDTMESVSQISNACDHPLCGLPKRQQFCGGSVGHARLEKDQASTIAQLQMLESAS